MGLEAITVASYRDAAGVLAAVVPGPVVVDAEVGIGVAAESGIDDVIFGKLTRIAGRPLIEVDSTVSLPASLPPGLTSTWTEGPLPCSTVISPTRS